jgi:hypothetical protein
MLALPGAVWAHAIGAEAKLKGGRVHLEAYYDDDTAADDAKVTVEGGGKVVAEGRTDEKGRWTFASPPAGTYRVTVDAGVGHRTTIEIEIPEGTVPAEVVSTGKRREDFTRFPWQGLTVGVGLLGLVAALSWALRRG